MATQTNGQVAKPSPDAPRFDPTFTQNVLNAMGPKTPPRLREVMNKLIPHLHDFAREVELTVDEWMQGVMLLAWAGQMTTEKRNEVQLVCDVLGLESYVFSPYSPVPFPEGKGYDGWLVRG